MEYKELTFDEALELMQQQNEDSDPAPSEHCQRMIEVINICAAEALIAMQEDFKLRKARYPELY